MTLNLDAWLEINRAINKKESNLIDIINRQIEDYEKEKEAKEK